jgi:hypothetical protein
MSNNTGLGWTVVKAPNGTGAFALSGNCFAGSTAAQTRRDNLTGFSDFATVQSQNPLPIELLHFDAIGDGEDVICRWATATEINNEYFELERSNDNEVFTTVTKVEGYGAGASSQVLNYYHVDIGVCNGELYYRLKQVDLDGTTTYSDVIAVKCTDRKSTFTLVPNPVDDKLTILSLNSLVSRSLSVTIYSMLGEKVMDGTFELTEQDQAQSVEISVGPLPSGIYLLEASTPERVFRGRFVKR